METVENNLELLERSGLNIEKKTEEPLLSKNKLKRMAKRQRWLELKPLRKAKEKEKRKMKIKKAKDTGQNLGPSRKMLKLFKMADSPCKLKICFDLSLAHLMSPYEFSKTFKQLNRCYSINRRAETPLQLYISGYTDDVKQTMSQKFGCFHWDVNFSQQSYCEMFEKSNITYLSSDSPNVLETLNYENVYVIGALVDHNRLKNVCYDKAMKEDVEHASLPLDKYFKFKTRKVLTICQVYTIFLRLVEGKSWVDAIADVVPKRKGIELKGDISSSVSSCDENKFEKDLIDCENISCGDHEYDSGNNFDNKNVSCNDSEFGKRKNYSGENVSWDDNESGREKKLKENVSNDDSKSGNEVKCDE